MKKYIKLVLACIAITIFMVSTGSAYASYNYEYGYYNSNNFGCSGDSRYNTTTGQPCSSSNYYDNNRPVDNYYHNSMDANYSYYFNSIKPLNPYYYYTAPCNNPSTYMSGIPIIYSTSTAYQNIYSYPYQYPY
jgi:hypothetical protein